MGTRTLQFYSNNKECKQPSYSAVLLIECFIQNLISFMAPVKRAKPGTLRDWVLFWASLQTTDIEWINKQYYCLVTNLFLSLQLFDYKLVNELHCNVSMHLCGSESHNWEWLSRTAFDVFNRAPGHKTLPSTWKTFHMSWERKNETRQAA